MSSSTTEEDSGRPRRKRQRVSSTNTDDSNVDAGDEADSYDRGKPLDPSLLDYLKRLSEQIETEILSDANNEDSSLMAASLIKTIHGNIYRTIVNRQGAKVIEKLSPYFSLENCNEILTSIKPAFHNLLCDRQASHACEAIINRTLTFSSSSILIECLNSLGENPPLTVANNFSTHPESYWPIIFNDERGSFIVRTLLKFDQTNNSSKTIITDFLPIIVNSLNSLKQADMIELTFNLSGSPTLNELLLTLVSRSLNDLFSILIKNILLVELINDGKGFIADDESKHHVLSLMQDRVGSHLLEGILKSFIKLNELNLISSFDKNFISQSFLTLALDNRANHVLQEFLQIVHKRKIINAYCEEIQAKQIKELIGQSNISLYQFTVIFILNHFPPCLLLPRVLIL